MSCYLFGASPIGDCKYIKINVTKDDILICADGGIDLARRLNLVPNVVVGDFDSAISQIDGDYEIVKLIPEKDDTDMKVAIEKGIELGQEKFIIYGGLGGRFDHSMANIQTMFEMKNRDKSISLELIDNQNRVFAIKDEIIEIPKNEYKYLSVLALSETVLITERGVKYPIEDYEMNYKVPLGVSNEITGDTAYIKATNGTAMIILAR